MDCSQLKVGDEVGWWMGGYDNHVSVAAITTVKKIYKNGVIVLADGKKFSRTGSLVGEQDRWRRTHLGPAEKVREMIKAENAMRVVERRFINLVDALEDIRHAKSHTPGVAAAMETLTQLLNVQCEENEQRERESRNAIEDQKTLA